MIHKKLITILLASLTCLCASAVPDGDEGEMVVIREEIASGSAIPPKAPAIVPIGCVYYPSIPGLEVSFLENLGNVSVEIENQTTSEYVQTVVNAVAGSMFFPVSGTSGHWTITFALPGSTYFGEFDVF